MEKSLRRSRTEVSTCEGDSCANYCRAWGCSWALKAVSRLNGGTTEKLGQPSGLKDTDEVWKA